MSNLLRGSLGLGALVALVLPATAAAPPSQGQQQQALASKLSGTWKGTGTDSASHQQQPITLSWKKASDGHMTGTVAVKGEAKYPVNVVWSSDTAFIYESGPHKSSTLHEKVVTRTLARFKGDSLIGQYELRPANGNKGRSLKGNFEAEKQA
jgi:hypothetical protein